VFAVVLYGVVGLIVLLVFAVVIWGGSSPQDAPVTPIADERAACEHNYRNRNPSYAENDRDTFIKNCMDPDEFWDANGDGRIGG
jgi:hypothetical protein